MRVLITGAEGFAGSHLVEHCLSQGDEVWGLIRSGSRLVRLAPFLDHVTLRIGDITRPETVRTILAEARFNVLYHLAAVSFVGQAEEDPTHAYLVNLLGGIHVLEALREKQPETRLLLVSSAEVYGRVPEEQMPIVETQTRRPLNVIAASKAALEVAARPYIANYGLQIVTVRPFNHTGPRQSVDFVCSSFARQVAEVESGGEPVVYVGDLSPKRDFTDVRDIVRGYRLLALQGLPGEPYNLASGHSVSMERTLNILVQLSRVRVSVRTDPQRARKTQVMNVRGSYAKTAQCCNWKPEIPLEKCLRDLLNWHRDVLLQERR